MATAYALSAQLLPQGATTHVNVPRARAPSLRSSHVREQGDLNLGLRICLCRVPGALKLGISQPEGNWGGNGSLGRQISGSTRLPSGPLQVGWRKSGSLRCSARTVPAERHCSKLLLLQALPRPQSGCPTIVALPERRVHFGQIWLAGASPLAAPRSSAPSGQPQRCFRRPALHARQHAPPRAPQPPPQPAHRCVACRPSHSRGQGCCSDFTEAVNCLPSPLLLYLRHCCARQCASMVQAHVLKVTAVSSTDECCCNAEGSAAVLFYRHDLVQSNISRASTCSMACCE